MTPTTFIVSPDCKSATAKAQMEKPTPYFNNPNAVAIYSRECIEYNRHISSLPTIHLDPSLQGKFQPGDEIEEGRDFVLGQKGSYNDTDGVVHEPSNTAYPLTDAGEGKRVCKYCGVATNMPEGECYKAPLPQSSKPEATGSGEKMKVVFDKEDKICSCGVPDGIHNTCCGWENANVVLFPFDNEITGAVSSYEKALRWKCRNNPDCAEFAVRTLRTYPHLSFSPQSPSASPVGVEELADNFYPGSYHQPLFDLMYQEHNLTLLESEMADIVHCVKKIIAPEFISTEGSKASDITDESTFINGWQEKWREYRVSHMNFHTTEQQAEWIETNIVLPLKSQIAGYRTITRKLIERRDELLAGHTAAHRGKGVEGKELAELRRDADQWRTHLKEIYKTK